MKTVLVIAYYFPPEGGPAVQRTLKFVKYLNQFGYKSIVISANHFAKTMDYTLISDIPDNTIVYRVFDFGTLIPDFLRKIFFGKNYIDKHQFWNFSLKIAAKKIFSRYEIDVIFSTTPPHSINIGACYLSTKYNIPWVADFRDEWTYDPNFGKQKNKIHIQELEKRTLMQSSAITTVTQKGKINFANIISSKEKTFCIYNGFDEDDYKHIIWNDNDKSILSIIYTGRLTKKSSPTFLFDILDNLIINGKIDYQKVKIKIVGPQGNRKWIQQYENLGKQVEFIDYQPHSISSQMLADSDVLLLLASNTMNSEVFTGKVFEYFFMRKPILAIVRYEGELSQLLKNHGNVYLGIESVKNSVENAFLEMYEDWLNGRLNKTIDEKFIHSFNRKDQARQLAEIFNKISNAAK